MYFSNVPVAHLSNLVAKFHHFIPRNLHFILAEVWGWWEVVGTRGFIGREHFRRWVVPLRCCRTKSNAHAGVPCILREKEVRLVTLKTVPKFLAPVTLTVFPDPNLALTQDYGFQNLPCSTHLGASQFSPYTSRTKCVAFLLLFTNMHRFTLFQGNFLYCQQTVLPSLTSRVCCVVTALIYLSNFPISFPHSHHVLVSIKNIYIF